MAKQWGVSLLLLVGVSLLSVATAVWVRGATPQDQSKYQQTTFTCFDGSNTIPISRVNDDYCDCESDGSDEPGTNACKKAKFYCSNKLYVSELLFSSRVNDGICDCCDGTDEWNSKATCPNTCREQGEQTRKDKLQALEDYREGLVIRQRYVEQAAQRKVDDLEKIKSLKADLENMKASVTEKEGIYNDNLSKEMAARELVEKYKRPDETVSASSVDEDKWDSTEDLEDGEPVPYTGDDEEAEVEGKTPEQVEEQAEPEQEAEPVEQQAPAEEKPELTEEIKEKLVRAKEILEEIKAKKRDLDDLKSSVTDIEREIKEKEDFLAVDFGTDSAYLPLYHEPVKFKTIEYTYEITPFKTVKQEYTSLGDWRRWLDNGKKMKYEDGGTCWGVSYKRNTLVSLVCGKENKILEVNEPNKCEYALTLATPAACEPSQLRQLEREYRALVNPVEDHQAFDAKDII